MTILFILFLFN